MKLSIVLAAGALAGCSPPSLVACDAAIKSKLRSPSTYQRVSDSGAGEVVTIEFDAVNSYNAPIRQKATCLYYPDKRQATAIIESGEDRP